MRTSFHGTVGSAHRAGLAALVVIFGAGLASADFIRPPGSIISMASDPCPGDDGCVTRLSSLGYLDPPAADHPIVPLLETKFPGWSIGLAENRPPFRSRLLGQVRVENYAAHVCDPYTFGSFPGYKAGDNLETAVNAFRSTQHCSHGATIAMEYERSEFDTRVIGGQDLFCIQTFLFTGGYCQTYYPRDTLLLDNGRDTTSPFYFGPRDRPDLDRNGRSTATLIDAPENGCVYAGDVCGGRCPEHGGDAWTMNFQTYFVAVTPGENTLELFDGVSWGFNARCIPSPAAWVLAVIGLFAMTRRR